MEGEMTSGLDVAVAAATAQSLSLALAAQTALIGKLLSTLMRSRVLELPDAATLLTDTADMIEEPLDRSPSDTQAVLIEPVRRHAQELRSLAKNLVSPI
jgi:hypothetical protein